MNLHVSPSAAAAELLRRRRARESLIGFSQAIEIPGKPVEDDEDEEHFASVATIETGVADHHRLLMRAFQRCVETRHGRLMLFMPPGSAKSTYASVVGPTWAMGRRSGFKVIGASYGSDLSRKLGRRCRSIVKQRGYAGLYGATLSAESAAADEWALTNGSEYMGGGILSGITGNRAHLLRDDDPLGRAAGEYLWPEWFDLEHWRQFQLVPRTWASLYQQRPAPDAGDIFKREWLKTYETLPDGCRFYGGSDYAVSDDGDFTVHVVAAFDRDGNLFIHDLWRGKGDPETWVDPLLDLVELHNPLGWAEETGQIVKSVGPFLRLRMRERKVFFAREQIASTTDKVARARSFQGQMASGKVFFRAGMPWLADLVSEMMVFPNGRHDDQVDAITKLTQLLDRMRGKAAPDRDDASKDPFLAKNAFALKPPKERL